MNTPPFVKRLGELHRQMETERNEFVLLDGVQVPKSALVFAAMLETELDPINREHIYRNILSECRLTDRTAAGVKFAEARYRELPDVVSLIALSNALTDNNDLGTGLARAKEALDLAIKEHALINYAAGSLMRTAITTGSVETVNEALDALVDSTQMPRKGDCALETDWTEKAEALGADKELIAWVRAVAARKTTGSDQAASEDTQ